MSIFSIGEMIRTTRKNLGLSQEKVSEGICSVATLSRIENGERVPSKVNFDALMQRMGQSGEMYDVYLGKNDLYIHEKKFAIRQAIIQFDFLKAEVLLDELKAYVNNENTPDKQFVEFIEIVINNKNMSNEERLRRLISTLKMTQPRYGQIKIYECLLTFDEITILNNIANLYYELGEYYKAIDLLFELVKFMDEKYINMEEKMRLFPMITYNLSKWLGLQKRYDESITICDMGIESCKISGRAKILCRLLYNKGWCLIKKEILDDNTKIILLQAYYVACAMDEIDAAKKYKTLIEKHFHDVSID